MLPFSTFQYILSRSSGIVFTIQPDKSLPLNSEVHSVEDFLRSAHPEKTRKSVVAEKRMHLWNIEAVVGVRINKILLSARYTRNYLREQISTNKVIW
jgi:hypothetical protein